MKRAHVLATLWLAAMQSGCSNSEGPIIRTSTSSGGAGTQTTGVGGTPSSIGAGSASAGGSAGASGSPSSLSGGTAGTGAAGGSTNSATGSGGSGAVSTGGSVATGGTAAVDAGSDAGAPSGTIPTPVTAPLIWGYGIGITDVPAAVTFYTGVMDMTVEKDSVKRDDRTETTLYGTQAMRGARLVLMKYDDMRNTEKITAKLVWQSQNAVAVNTAASTYPSYVSRLNFGIVQFDGPETYIQEVGGIFDSGGSAITVPYSIAIGFAVSNQPASLTFYTALGMTQSSLGSFGVTDATGAGTVAEYTVKYTDGMGAVLQAWTPMRNATNNPVKLVLMVPDAKAMADKVVAAGGTIVTPAARTPVYDNRLLVVAKDLDGYLLEIVE